MMTDVWDAAADDSGKKTLDMKREEITLTFITTVNLAEGKLWTM